MRTWNFWDKCAREHGLNHFHHLDMMSVSQISVWKACTLAACQLSEQSSTHESHTLSVAGGMKITAKFPGVRISRVKVRV